MNLSVRSFLKGMAGLALLASMGGCATGIPIHARGELAKENTINRIAVFGSGRVIWPRLGGKEPVIGLEASKQTLEAVMPLIKAGLTEKGYQPVILEPVGVFPNPTYTDDWVFPAKGEFVDPEEKPATQNADGDDAFAQPQVVAKPDKTASFGKPYQVEGKNPVFVYDGYAKDATALASAKSVFDFLDQLPASLPADSKIGQQNPPADAMHVLGSRTGADTLCFARVTGNRFTAARKAAVVAMNAATIWFGVVVIPPQDSAALNLACYDAASGKLAWHSAYGAYLGDPEKPNGDSLKHGFKYFPIKGKPMQATCKPDETKPALFICSDPESGDRPAEPQTQAREAGV